MTSGNVDAPVLKTINEAHSVHLALGWYVQVFNDGMMDVNAYGPFPNAILFNWATIFVLGFGNLAALDFQVHS